MVLPKDQIYTAALQLDPIDREYLVEELLLSLTHTDHAELDRHWVAEVINRDQALVSGTVTAKPFNDFLSRLAGKVTL